MRVKLNQNNLNKLFSGILNNKYKIIQLIAKHKVSRETIGSWRRGKTTMPLSMFIDLVKIAGMNENKLSPKFLEDFWHIKSAARNGGLMRMKLYGDLGTLEGRRKGGLRSIATHRKNKDAFKLLKSIKTTKLSNKLAEFMGILFGDGHLSKYQASITTNSQTDIAHAYFSKKIILDLFGIQASLKKKKDENAINVVASSKKLVEFLNSSGMPIGNKIKNNLAIPTWINSKLSYQKAFIRGLFDADGCIYIDTHRINKKIYKNFGWTITSYADKLILGIITILKNLGFSPTHRDSQKSVFLRRRIEIDRYFKEISTSNPKHRKRYKEGCAEW